MFLSIASPNLCSTASGTNGMIRLANAGRPKTAVTMSDAAARCSVIALEDQTRDRTSQDRTRGENSRLMQWAHRAIVKKLADIAKPFGI